MAKDLKMNGASDGGQVCPSDGDAAPSLAKGNPKARKVETAWGQRDQSAQGQKLTGR